MSTVSNFEEMKYQENLFFTKNIGANHSFVIFKKIGCIKTRLCLHSDYSNTSGLKYYKKWVLYHVLIISYSVGVYF